MKITDVILNIIGITYITFYYVYIQIPSYRSMRKSFRRFKHSYYVKHKQFKRQKTLSNRKENEID